MAEFGLPYMGSKGLLAKWVLSKIPPADHIYDLFGGGFAISHCAVLSKRWKNIHYNEIQKDVVDLVSDSIRGKYSYDRFKPEWISRDNFFRLKSDNAYIRYVWSFGNNGKGYLFGKEIEGIKKSAHDAVVFGKFDKQFIDIFGFDHWSIDNIVDRRLYLKKVIKFKSNERVDLQQLERLQQLQQLEQLERLQQLEQLEQLERPHLHLTSGDFRDLEIKDNSVVYCDPPYIGTASYSEDGFDHESFYAWARESKHPIFISEYTMPDDFKVISSVSKIQKLSSQKKNRKYFYETLFSNKIGWEMYNDFKNGALPPKTIIRSSR